MRVYTLALVSAAIAVFGSKKAATEAATDGDLILSSADDLATALSVSQMAEVFNKLSDKPVKKFADKKTGARRLFDLIVAKTSGTEVLETKEPKEKAKAKAPKVSKTATNGAHTKLRDKVIVIVTAENPRRVDTKAWKAYNLIKKGMTVGEYLKAGGNMQDLTHDVKKKNLKLEG